MSSSSLSLDNGVGIMAMEVYFPSIYVSQPDLEVANGVSAGKYTIGLGQDNMAFTGDREDINSIALTVVHSLLEKYQIAPSEIGRLEIGTESLVDKSKSTKTVLMSLFPDNADIEGATVVNACYGGTAALLNALLWADSSAWDGRYAIVVAADIAVYADGPARPTGGLGAVAMLVGRHAPLQINLKTRTTHATNVWDFFKPNLDSEYPEVNGALSQLCYLRCLDDCYLRFIKKQEQVARGGNNTDGSNSNSNSNSDSNSDSNSSSDKGFGISGTDHFIFHSSYNKLVQKSFARMVFLDVQSGRLPNDGSLSPWLSMPTEQTYEDKKLEAKLKEVSESLYKDKVSLACHASKQVGNTYTASVYLNLASLVSYKGDSLSGARVTLFSYGSGAISSMLEINPVSGSQVSDARFTLASMQKALNIEARLNSREKLTPQDLTLALNAREASHGFVPFKPTFSTANLFPGTYYLDHITTNFERNYKRKPLTEQRVTGQPLQLEVSSPTLEGISTTVSTDNEDGLFFDSAPVGIDSPRESKASSGGGNGSFKVKSTSFSSHVVEVSRSPSGGGGGGLGLGLGAHSMGGNTFTSPLRRNQTYVWASGRPNVRVVVTGVAAALPGRDSTAIIPGINNVQRIINGENCIKPIPVEVRNAMLDKNVVMLIKGKDGTQKKVPVKEHSQHIGLCASIGEFNLGPYGVPDSIASTMDRAVQVAVAAGLEALKDARIVTGVGEGGWVLPKSMQDTTGVVYATSFPALDTAIMEVSKYFETKTVTAQHIPDIITGLRERLQNAVPGGELAPDTEMALSALQKTAEEAAASVDPKLTPKPYEFDRKFLFRVLVLGNAQLAQIIKARGPNMQTNAACAGATQAIALAYDIIQVGRAERMIVVAGDNAASDTLMPWLGNGFRALGAATICHQVELAAIPFDKRRSGMILGSGGIGMILESEEGAVRRFNLAAESGLHPPNSILKPFRCRLLGTLISNSAYHGASLDRDHIALEMERFIASVEKENGISRSEIARHGVYFSHETSTHASPTSSCASNEIHGLRKVFGEDLKHLLILNTKGFTGHPMGVSFEDVVASEVLSTGMVPPIANFVEADPILGDDIKLSKGGHYPCKYAMRFAAGFGSQVALALYGTADT